MRKGTVSVRTANNCPAGHSAPIFPCMKARSVCDPGWSNAVRRSAQAAIASLMLAACAPMPPLPFELVAGSRVHEGTLIRAQRRIEVTIDKVRYQGYYIVAAGVAYSEGWSSRWAYPNATTTTYLSNSARASLVGDDGSRLTCQFLFEDERAVGECSSTSGQTFQLVTQAK
jgi:hypothetical protein